jgi:hypothetical protein
VSLHLLQVDVIESNYSILEEKLNAAQVSAWCMSMSSYACCQLCCAPQGSRPA